MKLTIENLEKILRQNRRRWPGSAMSSPPASTEFWAQTARARVLCSVCLPDTLRRQSGQILWDGTDILKLGRRYRSQGGLYAPGAGLLPQMSAREFLLLHGRGQGPAPGARKAEAERLLKAVDLWDVADRKLGQFSGGMSARPAGAGHAGRPRAAHPRRADGGRRSPGAHPHPRLHRRTGPERIVLLATHVVTDVECIADRVLLANKGKLLKADRPKTFIASIQTKGGGKALHAGGDRALPAAVRLRLAVPAAGGAGASPHRRRAARRVRPWWSPA